jgi:hypothetical protein
VPCIEYWVNQTEIAAKHCENKSEPELKCNGKCYLAKQLKKVESKENSDPVNSKRSKAPRLLASYFIEDSTAHYKWSETAILKQDYRSNVHIDLRVLEVLTPPPQALS